jgi:hypothetical protein
MSGRSPELSAAVRRRDPGSASARLLHEAGDASLCSTWNTESPPLRTARTTARRGIVPEPWAHTPPTTGSFADRKTPSRGQHLDWCMASAAWVPGPGGPVPLGCGMTMSDMAPWWIDPAVVVMRSGGTPELGRRSTWNIDPISPGLPTAKQALSLHTGRKQTCAPDALHALMFRHQSEDAWTPRAVVGGDENDEGVLTSRRAELPPGARATAADAPKTESKGISTGVLGVDARPLPSGRARMPDAPTQAMGSAHPALSRAMFHVEPRLCRTARAAALRPRGPGWPAPRARRTSTRDRTPTPTGPAGRATSR